MLVSIIVPIFNVEKYIQRCLESVFNQSYPTVELILVNDCTPDNSMAVVDKILTSYPDRLVSIINHNVNGGLSAARNTGIDAAKGDYIFFLDSDDELPVDSIAQLVNMVKQYPGIDIVQGNYRSEPDNWFSVWKLEDLSIDHYSTDRRWITERFLARDTFPVMAWNRLIKREFILQHKLYFMPGIIHEDEHWNFFMSKYIGSFVWSKDTTYIYHQNTEGITLSEGREKRSVDSYVRILNHWANNITAGNEDLQIEYLFQTAYNLFQQSKYNRIDLLKSLYPLFPIRFGQNILDYLLSKKTLTSFDILIIKVLLKCEKFIKKVGYV